MKVETVAISSLHEDPANARKHGDRNIAAIKASLARFEQQRPIVVGPGDVVVAGNGTLRAARELGWDQIQIVRTDLEGVDRVAFAIADNRTAELAEWDDEVLVAALQSLAEDPTFDLEVTGFDELEVESLLYEHGQIDSDVVDPGPEDPPETPVSRSGDLWLLGEHRILCGDSTSADDMARLMADDTAVLLATDPPYLVDYDGTNHPAEHHKKAGRKETAEGNEVGNKHWDAYVDPETSVSFFADFLRVALAHCIDRVPVYQWHATRRQALVEQAWEANGLLLHQTLIWVKTRGVLTRSHYLWQHEPCFYGWPKGMMPEKERRPATDAKTVWAIEGDALQDGSHPTIKPVAIFERPIHFHTRPGEVVLEPFSGSGTQILAAERLKRRCRAMEISPAFVDVAVKRWQKATGVDAILESSGLTFSDVEAERLPAASH